MPATGYPELRSLLLILEACIAEFHAPTLERYRRFDAFFKAPDSKDTAMMVATVAVLFIWSLMNLKFLNAEHI